MLLVILPVDSERLRHLRALRVLEMSFDMGRNIDVISDYN